MRRRFVIPLLAALLAPALAHAAPNVQAKSPKAPAPKAAPKAKGPCYAKPVQLMRVRGTMLEPREVALTFCNGKPNPAAVDTVSVLARPRDVERPLLPEIKAYRARPLFPKKLLTAKVTVKNAAAVAKAKTKYRDPQFVTERVMRIDPGLLERLQKVANRYPGKVIEIISGYRPDARETSRHHHGRALDMRVDGITREKLRDYVRTFEKTGVGYYPNSYFVHMDVRDEKGFWIDRAGPGEAADYGPWPVAGAGTSKATNKSASTSTSKEVDKQREAVLKGALAAVAKLSTANARPQPMAQAPVEARGASARDQNKARVAEPEQEPDDMRPDEIATVRAEARAAMRGL